MGAYANPNMGAYPQTNTASPMAVAVSGARNRMLRPTLPAATLATGRYRAARAAHAHVIPNPFDNTILIQGTSQEYEQILGLMRQLDIPPRQVLIDAKIYEVDLNGAFAAGVTAFLEKKDTGAFSRTLTAATGAGGIALTTGALVLRSHELLAALHGVGNHQPYQRVISAPCIIATDSIPHRSPSATPCPFYSQAVPGGVQQSGNSLLPTPFPRSSASPDIMARVNSSSIVTMVINQNVTAPEPPASSSINRPSSQNVISDPGHRAGRRHHSIRRNHQRDNLRVRRACLFCTGSPEWARYSARSSTPNSAPNS